MGDYIQISKLNDFIFCPYSVYLHSVYEKFNQKTYHSAFQTVGKICHENIEEKKYTTAKWILQGLDVFSEKYGLVGKIDIFDTKKGSLVERKYKIKKIFDGYKYQLYAQMFCLEEAGYKIESLFIHSLSDNKRYRISLPDDAEIKKFELLIKQIKDYSPSGNFRKNLKKCSLCIYKLLCF